MDEQGRMVRNPGWAVRIAPEYPRRAMRDGVEEGSVVLECVARADGGVRDCQILSETPSGHGFADAALEATKDARFHPQQIDGVSQDASITFTTRFRLD